MAERTNHPGERLGLPAEGAWAIAPLRLRALAHAIDLLVVVPAGWWVPDDGWGAGFVYALLVVNLLVLPARWGTTIGKAACRLRVVPVVDGEVLREQRGVTVLTALGCGLVEIVCWPFLLLVALSSRDEDRRTLGDQWTKTAVVEW